MPSTTTNYGLALYNATSDQAESFLTYRTTIAGISAASNMSIIDDALGTHDTQITALEGRKNIIAVAATYVSPNYYEATVSDITSYDTNQIIALKLNADSVGTVTLNVNALGIKSVMKVSSAGTYVNLAGSDMRATREYNCKYDGTRYVWMDATAADQININGTVGNIVHINANNELEDSAAKPSDFVTKALFDANTVLAATADDTPVALSVPEQTLVGRITAGVIDALTVSEAQALLNVENGADVTDVTNVTAAGALMDSEHPDTRVCLNRRCNYKSENGREY